MSDTSTTAGQRTVTVTLGIDSNGVATVLNSAAPEAKEAATRKAPTFDVPFDSTYANRSGFVQEFLDPGKPALAVHLPKLSDSLSQETAKLISAPGKNQDVLNYHGYSVVMHEKRRFAIYSAANVDFGGRYELARPADVWRLDPRISAEAQLGNFYYAGNQFDRGHLTRREDMEYGSTRLKALESAADTCHWSNCTPQHARFNQNRALWQGIERHLFEDGIQLDQFRAQVITGPVLSEGDPTWAKYPTIQYPVRYWKVVAAVTASGKLFATAYVLDQTAVVGEFGIEAAREVPFDAYKTFQVPIKDVEQLTQLSFFSGPAANPVPLSIVDPLVKVQLKQHASRVGVQASALAAAPAGWLPLQSLDAIVRPD
jgi:endonuclease G